MMKYAMNIQIQAKYYQGKIKERDTSGDTAVGKPCVRHGGIWWTGVKNPPFLHVGTEWDEWLPSRPGCLNPGERVPVAHPTGITG
jgi:hypothetical protein